MRVTVSVLWGSDQRSVVKLSYSVFPRSFMLHRAASLQHSIGSEQTSCFVDRYREHQFEFSASTAGKSGSIRESIIATIQRVGRMPGGVSCSSARSSIPRELVFIPPSGHSIFSHLVPLWTLPSAVYRGHHRMKLPFRTAGVFLAACT